MKRKDVNLSTQEIDLLTKGTLNSIKGGNSTNNSIQNPPSPIKDDPWIKIGISINF